MQPCYAPIRLPLHNDRAIRTVLLQYVCCAEGKSGGSVGRKEKENPAGELKPGEYERAMVLSHKLTFRAPVSKIQRNYHKQRVSGYKIELVFWQMPLHG